MDWQYLCRTIWQGYVKHEAAMVCWLRSWTLTPGLERLGLETFLEHLDLVWVLRAEYVGLVSISNV